MKSIKVEPARMTGSSLAERLGNVFRGHQRQLILVGGAVRDEILHRPRRTRDLDFATDAPPDMTREILLTAAPSSVYSIGEKFGTIGAVFDDIVVEITTFRGEVYQVGSRKPQVRFGATLEDDLARRDFTINAMAKDPANGGIIDHAGGLADLKAGLIRAVGIPSERFAEDPLRLLRAVRFAAQLGFTIEEGTAAAARESSASLRFISRERIFEEMNRLLLADHPAEGLRLLADLGLLDIILPEVLDLRRTTQGTRSKDVFEHTVRVVGRTRADQILRWAALLHDIGKPRTIVQSDGEIHFPGHEAVGEKLAGEILTRLRADGDVTDRVRRLTGLHMRANQFEDEWSDGAVRRLAREAGEDFGRLLELSTADVTSYRAVKVEAARARVERLRNRVRRLDEEAALDEIKSPLDGVELMALFGRGPGPWIKPVKDYLLDLVLDGQLKAEDKAVAEAFARRFLEE